MVTCLNPISHDLPKILILLRAWNTPRSITLARPTNSLILAGGGRWRLSPSRNLPPLFSCFLPSSLRRNGRRVAAQPAPLGLVGLFYFRQFNFFCVKSWIYCRLILMGTGSFMPDLTRIMVSRGAVSFQMKTSSVGDSELTMLNGRLQREYICRSVW